MASHHLRAAGIRTVGQEIERESLAGVVDPVRERQAQPQQRVEQVMLRSLQKLPAGQEDLDRQVRDYTVMATSWTQAGYARNVHQPVAAAIPGIIAEPDQAVRLRQGTQKMAFRLHRRNLHRGRQEAELMAA